MAKVDRPEISNGDANGTGGVAHRVVADGSLVIEIWVFLP